MNSEIISTMTARIARDFAPLQIVLFGSQARGDVHPHSDVDLHRLKFGIILKKWLARYLARLSHMGARELLHCLCLAR